MANTGIRLPQAQTGFDSNGANVIDDTVAADDATAASIIMFSGDTDVCIVSDFAGDDLPAGATVVGVEIQVKMGFAFSQATTTFSVGIDGAGGSFSSTTISQASNSTAGASTTIFDLGGDEEDFGLDWSGFTDMTDLAIKTSSTRTAGAGGTSIQGMYLIRANLYYTEAAAAPDAPVTIKGGTFTLKGGTLTIK